MNLAPDGVLRYGAWAATSRVTRSIRLAHIHFGQRQITAKIVYFGAPRAGSGTNVRQLHRLQAGHDKSNLERSDAGRARSWHFSYRPSEVVGLTDFELDISVASVPSLDDPAGQHTLRMRGVDAVVFVADARADRIEDNLGALLDLEQRLVRAGVDPGAIPMVIQVNHTDAANARPLPRVVETLNSQGVPVFEAIARQGRGVVPTHDAIVSALMARLRDNLADNRATVTLTSMSRASRDADETVILEHVAGLDQPQNLAQQQLGSPTAAEIALRPRELRDATPVHLIRAELRGERLRLELVVRRLDGATRKLAFTIQPGGDATPVPEAPPTVATPPLVLGVESEIPDDLPGLAYGVIGLVAGITSGILLGYLMFG